MSSKEHILAAIRKQSVPLRELPSLDQPWITYPDRFAQFQSLVQSVGGRCVLIDRAADAAQLLQETPTFTAASKIVSLVPEVSVGNFELNAIDDPHQLETIDWAIVPGKLGVAENGAIWLTDTNVKHRVIFFICQHLVVLLPLDSLVNNLHEAYGRIEIPQPGFGMFLSGPSKTADIEQSLVIGAHGPRSLTVFCYRQ